MHASATKKVCECTPVQLKKIVRHSMHQKTHKSKSREKKLPEKNPGNQNPGKKSKLNKVPGEIKS